MTTAKLYSVTTLVEEFHGSKDVFFSWFNSEPQCGTRPYADLIADYVPDDDAYYAEAAIDEAFSEDEARQLKDWLDATRGGTTAIEEMELPIAHNTMALSAIPVGGGTDFLMICEAHDSLPFKAMGYFDLRE